MSEPINLITDWTNASNYYDHFTSSGANITEAIADDQVQYAIAACYTNSIALDKTKKYRLIVNLTLNSGQAPFVIGMYIIPPTQLSTGPNIVFDNFFPNPDISSYAIQIQNTTFSNWSATFELKEITGTISGNILFDCEFEGTFDDRISGIVPTPIGSPSIDIVTKMFGSGCLKLPTSSDELSYDFPAALTNTLLNDPSGFTIVDFVMFSDELSYEFITFPAYTKLHLARVFKRKAIGYDIYFFYAGNLLGVIDDSDSSLTISYAQGGFSYVGESEITSWIDGIQIMKGALWTSNFTPPSKPFGLFTPKIIIM